MTRPRGRLLRANLPKCDEIRPGRYGGLVFHVQQHLEKWRQRAIWEFDSGNQFPGGGRMGEVVRGSPVAGGGAPFQYQDSVRRADTGKPVDQHMILRGIAIAVADSPVSSGFSSPRMYIDHLRFSYRQLQAVGNGGKLGIELWRT